MASPVTHSKPWGPVDSSSALCQSFCWSHARLESGAKQKRFSHAELSRPCQEWSGFMLCFPLRPIIPLSYCDPLILTYLQRGRMSSFTSEDCIVVGIWEAAGTCWGCQGCAQSWGGRESWAGLERGLPGRTEVLNKESLHSWKTHTDQRWMAT